MKIGDCHKCGEPVMECTEWDISLSLGFTCEACNKQNVNAHERYVENAAWLKEHNRKVNKQLNG
ncbi:hypothetical protein [Psychrobacillus sp.]|uniref:hypothetical protein n=1 Tax=Psychrobacillus sp. TaxID=1871623 RepID=UPI0028BD9C88|nr:hypothetical protein [Psychrobacillus sp.]